MKNIVFISLFLLCTNMLYAMVFSDWNHKTDNGTTIGDTGGGTDLLTNKNTELYNLTKWYFYKDHIIGEYRSDINDDFHRAYFIVNELNGDLKIYDDKNLFENELTSQQLVPLLWTRWYTHHSQFIYLLGLLWLFYKPIMICMLLFISFMIFLAVILKHKVLKIIFTGIACVFLVPPLLFIINDFITTSV